MLAAYWHLAVQFFCNQRQQFADSSHKCHSY